MSFQTSDWFATFNKRETSRIEVVLHFGAKKREGADVANISDPNGLLKALAKDRCMLTILSADDLQSKEGEIKELIREWIRFV